jgi:quercetin dioxygenase-like cupin family protein
MTDGITHDLPRLAREALGKKPAWSLQSEDLNVNLVSCTTGQGIGSHVNREVDVLLVAIDGEGSVEIDGAWYALRAGQAVLVPKGAQRATRCDGETFAYLTCHRRRTGLWPVPRVTAGELGETT